MTDQPKRPYHSPVRSRHKAATRQRIIDAALSEFASRGFTGTTIRSIADRARVSSESVHLVGQKAGLLLEALDQVTRRTVPELTTDTDLEQALNAGVLERVVERLVDLHANWSEQSARVWLVASVEALADEEMRQRLDLTQAQRRADWQWVAEHVPNASPHLAAALEVATSPETYLQVGGGEHASWLRSQFEALLGSPAT